MLEAEDGYNELRAETPREEILISLGLPRTVASIAISDFCVSWNIRASRQIRHT